MFASRFNQENAVHQQQTTAAAKSLNQGIKGLAPKTPGRQHGKNDENATFGLGKAAGGKGDRNAFVTPANNRTRAPLGAKTANTRAIKTPTIIPPSHDKLDPQSESNKPTSPRLRRSKIKVHGGEQDVAIAAPVPEEREIEYMAPREVPLPDYPDDVWPHDREYPELQGRNFTRGFFSTYGVLRERDEGEEESDFEEQCRQAERRAALKKKTMAQKQVQTSRVPTITAQRAASALSSNAHAAAAPAAARTARPSGMPSFAAPTVAVKARQPAMAVVKRPSPTDRNPRFTAAKTASNSTIGYSRGRVVSASAKKQPLDQVHVRPGSVLSESRPNVGDERGGRMTSYEMASPARKDILLLSELHLGNVEDEDAPVDGLDFGNSGSLSYELDELDDFQLSQPEET